LERKTKNIIKITIIILGTFFLIRDWDIYHEFVNDLIKSDFEKSLEYANIQLENYPNDPWKYTSRGDTYKRYKKYDAALKDYFKALELNETFSFFVYHAISNVYLATGNTEKAYEYINKSIKIQPYPENVLFDLAIIYDYEWKSNEALKTYSKYITQSNMKKFKRKYIFSLKRRIVHYTLLREYDKAKNDFETLLKEKPDEDEIEKLKGLVSDTRALDSSNIRKEFILNVHEAIVVHTKT